MARGSLERQSLGLAPLLLRAFFHQGAPCSFKDRDGLLKREAALLHLEAEPHPQRMQRLQVGILGCCAALAFQSAQLAGS